MPVLTLSLLGPFAASLGPSPLGHFRSNKAQALLVYLAVNAALDRGSGAGRAQRREQLMDLLWPRQPHASAQVNLRQALYQLRQLIPFVDDENGEEVPFLVGDRITIAIHPDAAFWLDVASFRRLLDGAPEPGALAQAVELYRGDFLADFYLPDSETFENWASSRRSEFRVMALDALDQLADQRLLQSRFVDAERYARRQLEIDNLRESAHRQLMLALGAQGQRTAALRQYDICHDLLAEELGVAPARETEELIAVIRAGQLDAALGIRAARSARPDRVPELSASPPRRHNLPLQLSSFVGRERELAKVSHLLDTSRLLTLTGPGGCGKTRLALQAASAVVDDYRDGVWFVDLASLSDPTLVPEVVASRLNVQEGENQPLMAQLQRYLLNRQLLLVLDNCEHVVAAVASLAQALLQNCPHLKILVTSREPLAIAGEVVWLVPSLSLPETEGKASLSELAASDAVCLFVERATSALSGFALTGANASSIEQLCRDVDGIPLAIELAAAQVRLLRVENIVAGLGERGWPHAGANRTALPHHRSLTALIDWSYDLLSPVEQKLLRHLSVFVGDFSYEAVEAIWAGDEGAITLDLLGSLARKSLVVIERRPGREARYSLLETIRRYAWAKLAEMQEDRQALARHLAFYVGLAEQAEVQLPSSARLLWLDRLETEYSNFQAALARSVESREGDLESGLRLIAALVPFWIVRSRFGEGRRWLDLGLPLRQQVGSLVRARLLLQAGWLSAEQWNSDPTELLEESLDLYRQLDDKSGIAWSLLWLGWSAFRFKGALAASSSMLDESMALAQGLNDRSLMSWLYQARARLAMSRAEFDRAAELSTYGLELARETGDPHMQAIHLYNWARSARLQREYRLASVLIEEARVLAEWVKDKRLEAYVSNLLGEVARVQGDYEKAEVSYRESLERFLELDTRGNVALVLTNLGLVAIGQGRLDGATSLFRESMALVQDEQNSLINVWALAQVAFAAGQSSQATKLFAVVEPMMHSFTTYYLDPVDRDNYERDVAAARTIMGEEAFAAAWAAGQAMSLEEAVALALDGIDTPT